VRPDCAILAYGRLIERRADSITPMMSRLFTEAITNARRHESSGHALPPLNPPLANPLALRHNARQ
jgi:hypothetical protein